MGIGLQCSVILHALVSLKLHWHCRILLNGFWRRISDSTQGVYEWPRARHLFIALLSNQQWFQRASEINNTREKTQNDAWPNTEAMVPIKNANHFSRPLGIVHSLFRNYDCGDLCTTTLDHRQGWCQKCQFWSLPKLLRWLERLLWKHQRLQQHSFGSMEGFHCLCGFFFHRYVCFCSNNAYVLALLLSIIKLRISSQQRTTIYCRNLLVNHVSHISHWMGLPGCSVSLRSRSRCVQDRKL